MYTDGHLDSYDLAGLKLSDKQKNVLLIAGIDAHTAASAIISPKDLANKFKEIADSIGCNSNSKKYNKKIKTWDKKYFYE